MEPTDPSRTRLVLPPDGRQTRIDFFQSGRSSHAGRHILNAGKGSGDWWHTLTSWFRAEERHPNLRMEEYIARLEEMGYSKKSRQNYLFMLKKFFEFFEDRDPLKITMGDIEDYNFEFFVSGRYSRPYQLQFINALKLYYQLLFNINLNLKGLRKTGMKRA